MDASNEALTIDLRLVPTYRWLDGNILMECEQTPIGLKIKRKVGVMGLLDCCADDNVTVEFRTGKIQFRRDVNQNH